MPDNINYIIEYISMYKPWKQNWCTCGKQIYFSFPQVGIREGWSVVEVDEEA